MIVYIPDPLEMINSLSEPIKTVNVDLPSGGYVTVQPLDYNKVRVVSITSTDPTVYLNNQLQPGNILTLSFEPSILK